MELQSVYTINNGEMDITGLNGHINGVKLYRIKWDGRINGVLL